MKKLTRRQFVTTAALGSAGLALGGCSAKGRTPLGEQLSDTESFTFVHLTDMHVRRKRQGHKGYRVCIDHVNALSEQPDFALMGGDLAFDGLYTEKEEFADQIELFRTTSDLLRIPYYNCIGNHDALGWSGRRKVPVDDPDIGKKMIMDRLGMKTSYYSFDHRGWHFVVLDCIYPVETDNGPGYEPRIGDEQLEWLACDLGATGGRPTVAMTHIAAFCNLAQVEGDTNAKAMTGMVLRDNKQLRLVLERHGVKALLQGHSHQTEDFCFNGVQYLTSPAVSAAWWGGNWLGFEPGYTVFRCHGNGQLTWERLTFPWEAQLEPEDTLERERIAEREALEAEQRSLLHADRKHLPGDCPAGTT